MIQLKTPFVALGLLGLSFAPAFGADDMGCSSDATRSQLHRLVIDRMKADQMLNDMADLDGSDFSLAQVRTIRKAGGSVACKAIATLRVNYGAGLRRTIDNSVTYNLLRLGEDQHVAVKLHGFATAF